MLPGLSFRQPLEMGRFTRPPTLGAKAPYLPHACLPDPCPACLHTTAELQTLLLPPAAPAQVDHIRFLASPVPLEPGSKITFQETPNTGARLAMRNRVCYPLPQRGGPGVGQQNGGGGQPGKREMDGCTVPLGSLQWPLLEASLLTNSLLCPHLEQAAHGTPTVPTCRGYARPTGRASPAPPPLQRSSMPISRCNRLAEWSHSLQVTKWRRHPDAACHLVLGAPAL